MLDLSATISPTKFIVPTIPNATVSRRALVARLDATGNRPLTLVTGPAGAGKTSLLAEWAHGLGARPLAWVSCDPGDADPERFWRALITVVRETWEGSGVEAADLLAAGERRELAVALADDLAAAREPGVIIIDDFHLARPDAGVFGAFVHALRPPARLVIGSRVDPPFPLARLRVQGLVNDVREADLNLDIGETAAALTAMGAQLDTGTVAEIHRLTEGWAAGVHLVGLAVGDTSPATTLIDGLARSDLVLTDFLINEVIEQQSDAMVEFLLATSVLEWFDVELAEAVTGLPDAAALLEHARRVHLFVVELDGHRGRFRYHHLFGQFLQARLRMRSPRREAEVLRIAAAVSRDRGDVVDAVTYLVRAGEAADAIGLLKAATMSTVTLVDGLRVADATRVLLREVGAGDIRGNAGVIIDALILLDIGGASTVTPAWLHRLEAVADELADADLAHLQLAWAAHYTQLGDPASSLDRLQRLAEIQGRTGSASDWAILIVIGQVYNRLWLDDLRGARALTEAAAVRLGGHAPAEDPLLEGYLALIDYLEGDVRGARNRADRSIETADALGLPENHNSRIEAFTVAGLCAAEADDNDASARYFERALRNIESTRTDLSDALIRTMYLRLSVARADEPLAWSWLEQSRSLLQPGTGAIVREHFDRIEARLLIAQGDLSRARRVIDGLPPSAASSLLQAQLALGGGDPAVALRNLDCVDDPRPTQRRIVTSGLLRVLALDALSDDAASDELARVLDVAERAGFHRTIVELGPPMWKLLRQVQSAHLRVYIDGLLSSSDRHLSVAADGPVPARHVHGQLVETLTEREITILRYLTSRLTTGEIAGELYISLNTVKSHVRAIYRKLDATSRSEALATARTVGLL